MKKLILIAMTLFAMTANAGGERGNGGDEIAIDFQKSFAVALHEIGSNGLNDKTDLETLKQTALQAQIIVVNQVLRVQAQGITQDSIAVNFPKENLIKINRKRWNAIQDDRIKEAVALHEILSLVGIERTGYYEYSGRYAAERGISPWEVSGESETAQKPRAKRFVCEIGYMPPGQWTAETFKVDELTVKDKALFYPSLSVRKTFRTKDDLYEIQVWAIQPYRTAFNLTAYEFTGMDITNLKNHTSASAGFRFPKDPTKNENNVRMDFGSDMNKDKSSQIDGSCELR